ncbi:gamma-glutamylcysteine synthetase [Artemisia annua]|uniref:Gamma-glutamylcysteine synthetase n=1 Tax=Artemisia annua TaxID=35608 RepID=A0A2U1Q1Y1_ARTAN|nr:gamma-glutamylcysteine synthetase [Artemisia annua]
MAVLKNLGIEVKLQWNALSVLEPPIGQEEDGELNYDHSSCGSVVGEKEIFIAATTGFRPRKVCIAENATNDAIEKLLSLSFIRIKKVKIGTEHEKFGFDLKTLHPMTYEQVAHLLNAISERFNWEKVMEVHNLPGLK